MARLRRRLLSAAVVAAVALVGVAPAADARPAPPGDRPVGPVGWGDGRDPTHPLTAVNGVTDPDAGEGVGIALIDSGVTASFAAAHGDVVVGPDVTGRGNPYDRYGHGTFLASLIVGGTASSRPVQGIAPGATLVSVKAARDDGTTDLGILMESVRWVIEHRADHDIRVLVLAVSTESIGDYRTSPLAAVLEAAWASGIVVVVPTGNLGAAGVTHPADDPWLLSVGASDTKGTPSPHDDTVASWSGTDPSATQPQLVAPGTSVVGARAPGSVVDRQHPSARLGHGLFVGSGTSMAAAIAAAAAAVVVEHHPAATPDDVKGAILDTARPIPGGAQVDLTAAVAAPASPDWVQHHEIALDGLGGTLTAMPWTGISWTGVSWTGVSWTGVSWTGVSWTGVSWTGVSWTGVSWTGAWAPPPG